MTTQNSDTTELYAEAKNVLLGQNPQSRDQIAQQFNDASQRLAAKAPTDQEIDKLYANYLGTVRYTKSECKIVFEKQPETDALEIWFEPALFRI